MRRLGWSGAILLTLSCASSEPDRVGVRVYQAPLSDQPAGMPRGCRLLLQHPPVDMSELRMTGPSDPFHDERVRAARTGGNVLLVRSRMIVPRMDYNCPAASPITDCPPSEGSWHLVVFEDFACSAEAMKELAALNTPSR
jgi:hypothetical protein